MCARFRRAYELRDMRERHVGNGSERTKVGMMMVRARSQGGHEQPTNEAKNQDRGRGTGGCRIAIRGEENDFMTLTVQRNLVRIRTHSSVCAL